jgi:hypothetical protein
MGLTKVDGNNILISATDFVNNSTVLAMYDYAGTEAQYTQIPDFWVVKSVPGYSSLPSLPCFKI